jgi:HlyD family secretion protein
MTASVRAVSQRHDGVLRVPNSALRFRPAADLIEKPAGGPVAGGPPGGPPDGGARPPRGPKGEGGGEMKGGGTRWAKAYLARGDKVAAVRFKPGIADDEFTEIAAGNLHEGDEVVVDASGGPQQAPPGGPMGGGNRGRGPRFF